jgi:branched-chain amino acid transport system substrate-binding protein
VLKPAGLDTVVGLITAYYGKAPEIRGMRDDPAVKDYFAWAKKWYPSGNAQDGIVNYGYQAAQALEYVLRRCDDDLTRENVMRVATHLNHVAFPMLLPGITASTSPTNYFPITQFQMLRFDGKELVPFGPIRGQE